MIPFRQFAAGTCVFAIALIPLLRADDRLVPSAPGTHSLTSRARAMLRIGKPAQAAELLQPYVESAPGDALRTLAGEIQYRLGDFAAAARHFQAALDRNPGDARAWWGLGRIERIHFRPSAARDLFAKAYRLDWRDPDIVSSYLEFVSDPAARRQLLQNLATLNQADSPERAAQAQAQLAIETRLAGREPGALASAYTAYRVPLRDFLPSGARPAASLVTMRINGGRPLRLVLDTGARGILLRQAATHDLALEPVAPSRIDGFGGAQAAESTLALAATVAIGDLLFRDCLIEVGPVALPDGADGVLGASLFERFRVRIDVGAQVLELTPRPAADAPTMPALGLDRLLLVRAAIPGGREGWFLLDTGAAFTAVAPALRPTQAAPSIPVPLAGVQGTATAFRSAPLTLRVGGRALSDANPVVFDLDAVSQRVGVEISGLLGYSTLRHWPVTIDFRSGMVRIGD